MGELYRYKVLESVHFGLNLTLETHPFAQAHLTLGKAERVAYVW